MPQPSLQQLRLRAARQGELASLDPVHEEQSHPQVGRLKHYAITGLFGHYDHAFDLAAEGPTILTGPNGSGKTTVLRSINAIGAAEWQELWELPFRTLRLKFEGSPQLRVDKLQSGLKVTWGKESFSLNMGEFDEWKRLEEDLLRERWREGPDLERRRREIRRRRLELPEKQLEDAPEWARDFAQRFPVRFVTDQRLVVHAAAKRPRRPAEVQEAVQVAVSQYGEKLGNEMAGWLGRYARASQREDRAFPELVVRAMTEGQEVDESELQALLEDVASRRAALERVGLVEPEDPGPRFDAESLNHLHVRTVMKTFAEVTLRKFDTLERFRKRLELLTGFLNEHFVGKAAATAPGEGLYFELEDGERLRPSDLSSGEQQMLVLAYELLFETQPGTLMLIDEPEISLHVAWQNRFVDDITAMGSDNKIQFLLATHSPTLIGGRDELKRTLGTSARP